MAAADSYIEEKDASGVTKKVKTRDDGTGIHSPYGAIIVADAALDTGNPLPVGGTLLGTIDSTLSTLSATATSILSAANAIKASAQLLDDAIAGTEMQVDVVSGAATVSGSVSMGVPTGNTKKQFQKNYTTAQTGTDLWTPAGGKRIAVKHLFISWQGANACRITIWQGANADTTFSEGSDPWVFDITLDANANGGAVLDFPDGYAWETTTADHELHVTISANKIVAIDVIGDERT